MASLRDLLDTLVRRLADDLEGVAVAESLSDTATISSIKNAIAAYSGVTPQNAIAYGNLLGTEDYLKAVIAKLAVIMTTLGGGNFSDVQLNYLLSGFMTGLGSQSSVATGNLRLLYDMLAAGFSLIGTEVYHGTVAREFKKSVEAAADFIMDIAPEAQLILPVSRALRVYGYDNAGARRAENSYGGFAFITTALGQALSQHFQIEIDAPYIHTVQLAVAGVPSGLVPTGAPYVEKIITGALSVYYFTISSAVTLDFPALPNATAEYVIRFDSHGLVDAGDVSTNVGNGHLNMWNEVFSSRGAYVLDLANTLLSASQRSAIVGYIGNPAITTVNVGDITAILTNLTASQYRTWYFNMVPLLYAAAISGTTMAAASKSSS
jgi:hypothetical protein